MKRKRILENRNFSKKDILVLCLAFLLPFTLIAQHSVARQWNELLLEAIRNDFARPTVHARNLFHTSVVMYDAWAAYIEEADTYFLGKTTGSYFCPFEGIEWPEDIRAAQEEAISYAAFRLILHRFNFSPGGRDTYDNARALMDSLGYDVNFISRDYQTGNPAALGNYLADQIKRFGWEDGSNERYGYQNLYYRPVNPPMTVVRPGNPLILDPNRWQPLTLDVFIDQSGNEIPGATPEFLSPEWGAVVPFAMDEDDLTRYERDSVEWLVYNDPGPPPYVNTPLTEGYLPDEYKWGFELVSIWSAQLDPGDGVMWDISPASLGNSQSLPQSIEAYRDFYQADGGDGSLGHALNPHTGLPYEPNIVPRGDYARVLAEFWADGPDSETPPGHWFTILNYVHDHPLFERRFKGEGSVLDELEWDVKAYFTLGGAMHDAAISSWGIKGWYDYLRPVSAIRYLAEQGQSSDPEKPNYSPYGISLAPGFIELVEEGDTLAGEQGEHIGKIKLFAWRGPNYIQNPDTDEAGVGWILAENWWPYQRPSFVTPNFAGYISGHSTYSRAAAEVLTMLTGDPFFPGGMGVFLAKKNEFLVFEEGPSVDVALQWATYRDASDQTSLSRIWGGIHPPADDIPGRIIGIKIAEDAFNKAESYFSKTTTDTEDELLRESDFVKIWPNPVKSGTNFQLQFDELPTEEYWLEWYNAQGQRLGRIPVRDQLQTISTNGLPPGIYFLRLEGLGWRTMKKVQVF